MAFDFPSSPTLGQQYSPAAGVIYTYNGYGWDVAVAAGGGSSITISDTPPASPTAGAMWWESDTGTLWIYYTDANSSQWIAVSAGAASLLPGTPVLIERKDIVSPVAAADFVTGIGATYDEYELHFYGVTPVANGSLGVRISQDGGATWKQGATDYFCEWAQIVSGGAFGAGSLNYITLGNQNANGAAVVSSGVVRFWQPSSSTVRKNFLVDVQTATGGYECWRVGGSYFTDTNPMNGLRFFCGGGNIATGTFNLYGIRK